MPVTTTPRLASVSVRPYVIPDTGLVSLSALVVEPVWDGVDHPNVGGWVVKDQATARRLERAIRDGNAQASEPVVTTDVNGQTYVHVRWHVMAKYMASDLRKLGY